MASGKIAVLRSSFLLALCVSGFAWPQEHAPAVAQGAFEDGYRPALVTTFPPRPSAWEKPAVVGGVAESPWFERERAAFTKLLQATRASTFVVPVQVQRYGIDRAARSYITARLTQAFAAPGERVDPYIVERAMGEGARHLDAGAIDRIARQLGARRVVVTYAGHDGKGVMHIAAQLYERESATTWVPRNVVELAAPLADTQSPEEVFDARFAAPILAMAEGRGAPSAKRASAVVALAVPATIAATFDIAARDAASRAQVYQLFGMLAPEAPERARERMFEQSLAALADVDPEAEASRLLRARALLYLHSRTAALAALGEPRSAEARAFAAYLRGNVDEMDKAVAGISDGTERLLAEIALHDLQQRYSVKQASDLPPAVEKFLETRAQWRPLVARRFAGEDLWKQQDNLELKRLLEAVTPVQGPTAEQAARGRRVTGQPLDPAFLGSLAFQHIAMARGSRTDCPADATYCAKSAFLDLIEADAISNVSRAVLLAGVRQSAFDVADALVRAWGGTLDGQPDFELAQVRVADTRMKGLPDEAKERAKAAKRRHAEVAFYWEHGQTLAANRATSGAYVRYWELAHEYSNDLPTRDFFWYADEHTDPQDREGKAARAHLWRQLRQSCDNLDPAMSLVGNGLSPQERPVLLAELAGRFQGSPQRADFTRLLAMAQGAGGRQAKSAQDMAAERRAQLEAAIHERPDLWSNYRELGTQLVADGTYEDAAALMRKYPGFAKPAGYNPVALSNAAYEAGSLFFWKGDFTKARPFYQIAADLETGSAASIGSAARLRTLDRDYEQAARGALERASRYSDPYAYRDYLSWLFAFGFATQAWDGFGQLAAQFENPQVWLAAHVGHRIQRHGDEELRKWLLSDPVRGAGDKERFALSEAIMLAAIDRSPPPDLGEFMRKLEGTPLAYYTVPPPPPGGWSAGAPPPRGKVTTHRGPGAVTLMNLRFRRSTPDFKDGDPVPSHLVYFADAYVPLRAGRFAEAADRFWAMAQLYPVEGTGTMNGNGYSYALPYFAWASARSGDAHHLEQALDSMPIRNPDHFDRYLANAFFKGLHGDHAAALSLLQRAFDSRPFTERRPLFTEYQWAEGCEWLFEATGQAAYRELALKMARANEEAQPFVAWSYAMEAKLSAPGTRQRALGFALYLDPRSERLSGIPAAEKEAAQRWFKSNNPFALPPPAKRNG